MPTPPATLNAPRSSDPSGSPEGAEARAAFCSAQARAADAQRLGTAAEARVYLVVEWPHPWKRKAVRDAAFPAPLRAAIERWAGAVPGLRVQLIRREAKRFDTEGVTTAYLCRTSLHAPALWRARVAAPEALADANVPALVHPAGHDAPDASGVFARTDVRTDERLVLTCTHGKRDRCCALYGRKLHDAFAACAEAAAWQTSHVKGHRFAPTCVLLPHGVHLGGLPPAEAAPAWHAFRAGQLHRLDRYRGHTGFARPVQAAAIYARRRFGALDLDAVRLLAAEGAGGETWRVRLAVRAPGEAEEAACTLVVERAPAAVIATSCGDAPKLTTRFRLVSFRIQG
jgi:hypothetical protein